jgi:hypothetical protein
MFSWSTLNIISNTLLSHHLFQSLMAQNRSVFQTTNTTSDENNQDQHQQLQQQQQTNESNHNFTRITQLIANQMGQSKCLISLEKILYILRDNCIHCYEFSKINDKSLMSDLNCLPFFRLPHNLSDCQLGTAIAVNTTTNVSSLFVWKTDDNIHDSSPLSLTIKNYSNSNSSSSSNLLANSNDNNDISTTIQSSDDREYESDYESEIKKIKASEALIYLINPQQGFVYEFYPAKNKLKKLPNLLFKHNLYDTFLINIQSKLYITGGTTTHQEGPIINNNRIEVLNQDKTEWSLFTTTQHDQFFNDIEQINNLTTIDDQSIEPSTSQQQQQQQQPLTIPIIKHFFKLKMSVI